MPRSKPKPSIRFDPSAAPGPAGRYRQGSLLVQQVRSRIGRDARQIAALTSLGLGTVGRSATCDVGSAAVREQLETVDFMLAVAPLSLDAVEYAGEEVVTHITQASLTDHGRQALITSDGDVAEIEAGDDQLTAMWSCALPAATALPRLLSGQDISGGEAVAVSAATRRAVRCAADVFVNQLPGKQALWSFIRLTVEGTDFYWEQAIYPRHVNEGVDPGRIGFRAPSDSRLASSIADHIRDTGTPAVALHASTVAEMTTAAVHA